jgi:hypothetical protein
MNRMFGLLAADASEPDIPAAAATPNVPLTNVRRVIRPFAIVVSSGLTENVSQLSDRKAEQPASPSMHP